MSEFRNFFLCYEDLTANGTLLSCCQACLCTGRCYCWQHFFFMACCIDCLGPRFITSAAFECLDSGFRTGRLFRNSSFIPVVSEFWDFFLRFEDLPANGTLLSGRQTSLCTGRFLCRQHFFYMSCRIDRFGPRLITSAAFECLDSGFRAGWIFRNCSFIPVVSEFWHFFLRFEDLAADGTLLPCCQACFCTGRFLCRQHFFFMACRIDRFGLRFITSAAFECFDSCFCACRLFRNSSFIPIMTEFWNFFLSFEDLVADGTLLPCCQACLCTGRIYCWQHFFRMCRFSCYRYREVTCYFCNTVTIWHVCNCLCFQFVIRGSRFCSNTYKFTAWLQIH